MLSDRKSLHVVKAMVKKDLLFEPAFRRVSIFYTAGVCAAILGTGLVPDFSLFSVPGLTGISPASQLFTALAVANTLLIPFAGYMFMIQGERQTGSFVLYRTLPIEILPLFWGRVFSCWMLSMIPIASSYILFVFMHVSGLLAEDSLTAILLGISFPVFIISLCWLTSTTAVGMAVNINSQMLPFVVTSIGVFLVLVPFLFRRVFVSLRFEQIIIEIVEKFGALLGASVFLLLMSLLIGGLCAWLFRRKRSYV